MRQLANYDILKVPNHLLTRQSKSLTFPLSNEDLNDIYHLKIAFRKSLKSIITLGLSAPQIGINSRFFLIPHHLNYTHNSPNIMSLLVKKFDIFINPSIKSPSA